MTGVARVAGSGALRGRSRHGSVECCLFMCLLNVRVYKYDIFLFGLLFIAPGTVGSRLVAAF